VLKGYGTSEQKTEIRFNPKQTHKNMKAILPIVTAIIALSSAIPQSALAHNGGHHESMHEEKKTDFRRDQKRDEIHEKDDLHRKDREEREKKLLLFLKRHHRNFLYEWEIEPFLLYPTDPCDD
jgi:hypothetical protein